MHDLDSDETYLLTLQGLSAVTQGSPLPAMAHPADAKTYMNDCRVETSSCKEKQSRYIQIEHAVLSLACLAGPLLTEPRTRFPQHHRSFEFAVATSRLNQAVNSETRDHLQHNFLAHLLRSLLWI